MRVVCIHIPPRVDTEAVALYETTWRLTAANMFRHQIDNLCESMWLPFSCELYSANNIIYVCMAGSDEIIENLTTGLYSWLPTAEVHEVEDYTASLDNSIIVGAEMKLALPDIYPFAIHTEIAFDTMVPAITPLSHLPEGDRMIVQVVTRPIKDSGWVQTGLALNRSSEKFRRKFRSRNIFRSGLPTKTWELVTKKCSGHLSWVSYRVAAFCDPQPNMSAAQIRQTEQRLSNHVKNFASSIKVYDTTDENRFVMKKIERGSKILRKVQERRFDKPFRVTTDEFSTLFHPPRLQTLPNTAQVLSKKGAPPRFLPTEQSDPNVCFFGHTNFRDQAIPFGIRRFDRRRHMYIAGKSGSGKSGLLQLLIRNDIEQGFGCAVLDPHGDLVDDILRLIPKHRVSDVVLFDPSDIEYPPSFNPMDPARPELKTRVTLSFLDTFRRVFGADWSERMDHVLRYAMMGLLHTPGSNIVSLRRMLSDEAFRGDIVRRTPDESVKRFWLRDFPAHRKEFEEGPISQLLNRLDELLATDMIRNIFGQSHNLYDFRKFMDNRKIVLLKISKGVLGAENATLLGSLVIWKIYEAAMSRADLSLEQREDFYFYVDEFQNFATDSFGEILSESRKYKLCLAVANQYLGQLSSSVRDTVFGNVANLLCFRLGGDDAATMAGEFMPFNDQDLVNLGLREFYLKMSINGEVQRSFSGRTLDLDYSPPEENFAAECIAHSRANYSVPVGQATTESLTPSGSKRATRS